MLTLANVVVKKCFSQSLCKQLIAYIALAEIQRSSPMGRERLSAGALLRQLNKLSSGSMLSSFEGVSGADVVRAIQDLKTHKVGASQDLKTQQHKVRASAGSNSVVSR